jgi:branched-chain amino acid transport system substrate-binding protein
VAGWYRRHLHIVHCAVAYRHQPQARICWLCAHRLQHIEQRKADATCAREEIKAKSVVTIHDGSPYAQQLQQVMADNFKAMGAVLSQEAIAPTDVDMHPLLTRIASEKPDLIYFRAFTAAGAQILRQAKETPPIS